MLVLLAFDSLVFAVVRPCRTETWWLTEDVSIDLVAWSWRSGRLDGTSIVVRQENMKLQFKSVGLYKP